jgi:hypothetical protein
VSSTNRGAARHPNDYYVTPVAAILRFLEEFEKDRAGEGFLPPGPELTILDPCAGGDSETPMSYPLALSRFTPWHGCQLRTLDVREDSPSQVHADYLSCRVDWQPWLIMTNPPFLHAVEVAQKALQEVRPGGLVVLLQRVNFFGSAKRLPFWRGTMPILTYVHSERMSFWTQRAAEVAGKRWEEVRGKTDSVEYAHYVWKAGYRPYRTQLRVI